MIDRQKALEILEAIKTGKWSWMKVKRFKPEDFPTVEEKYDGLQAHHLQETQFMLDVIKDLCELVKLENKDGI